MDNSKKKINALLICNSYPTIKNPHDQIFIKNIKQKLIERNVYTDIFFNKIFLYWRNASHYKGFIPFLIKYTFFILGIIPLFLGKTKKYDIITPHSVLLSGFIGSLLKKLFKKSVVTYIHGGDLNLYQKSSLLYKKIFCFTVNQTDQFIVNSKDLYNKLIKYFNYPNDRIKVISPGVDLNLFYPLKNKTRENFNISKGKFVILFAGAAIKRKGVDVLIKALNELPKKILSKMLSLIITDGPEKSDIINQIKINNLIEYIRVYKKIDQNKLNEFFNIADVVIIPSREEPLGLVGLEALATKTPVIASNVGGIPDYVKHGYNGLLFDSENYKMLAMHIINLIQNPKIISKLKKNALLYPKRHSIEKSSEKMRKIYEKYV